MSIQSIISLIMVVLQILALVVSIIALVISAVQLGMNVNVNSKKKKNGRPSSKR